MDFHKFSTSLGPSPPEVPYRYIPTWSRYPIMPMTVTREDLNPCTVKLDVVCDPAQVDEGFDRAIKGFAKRIRVPGFRPGHAPKEMIEQMLGKDELYQAAADTIVNKVCKQAIEQEQLKPDDNPMVNVSKLDRDEKVCEFTAKVPLAPIVELGEYKGLAAQKPKVEVTDDEVEAQLEELRKRSGKREAVTDRGVQDGDIAVVNIKVDGEEGDGRNFMTIAGQTFPQLDQAIMGMQVEEMKQLNLTFPDNFQEKDWAGKLHHVQVSIRSLNSVRLPELDDAFAQNLKAKDVGELKEKVKDQIKLAKDAMLADYVNEQLQEDLLKRCTVHVPDNMWEAVANQRLRELAADVQQRGKTMEDYAQENGMTMDQLVEAWKNEAKTHVMRAVVIRDIFVKEGMKLSNADLNQELFVMAGEYQMKPEDLLAALRKHNGLRELEFRAIFKKVIAFLNENAAIQEVSA